MDRIVQSTRWNESFPQAHSPPLLTALSSPSGQTRTRYTSPQSHSATSWGISSRLTISSCGKVPRHMSLPASHARTPEGGRESSGDPQEGVMRTPLPAVGLLTCGGFDRHTETTDCHAGRLRAGEKNSVDDGMVMSAMGAHPQYPLPRRTDHVASHPSHSKRDVTPPSGLASSVLGFIPHFGQYTSTIPAPSCPVPGIVGPPRCIGPRSIVWRTEKGTM